MLSWPVVISVTMLGIMVNLAAKHLPVPLNLVMLGLLIMALIPLSIPRKEHS